MPPLSDAAALALLEHTATCVVGAGCPVAKCERMRAFLRHPFACPVRLAGGCAECDRFWKLLTLHAQSCAAGEECAVMHCAVLKRHLTAHTQVTAPMLSLFDCAYSRDRAIPGVDPDSSDWSALPAQLAVAGGTSLRRRRRWFC